MSSGASKAGEEDETGRIARAGDNGDGDDAIAAPGEGEASSSFNNARLKMDARREDKEVVVTAASSSASPPAIDASDACADPGLGDEAAGGSSAAPPSGAAAAPSVNLGGVPYRNPQGAVGDSSAKDSGNNGAGSTAAASGPRHPLDGTWEIRYEDDDEDEDGTDVVVQDHCFYYFGAEAKIEAHALNSHCFRLRWPVLGNNKTARTCVAQIAPGSNEAERTWVARIAPGTTAVGGPAIGETLRWSPDGGAGRMVQESMVWKRVATPRAPAGDPARSFQRRGTGAGFRFGVPSSSVGTTTSGGSRAASTATATATAALDAWHFAMAKELLAHFDARPQCWDPIPVTRPAQAPSHTASASITKCFYRGSVHSVFAAGSGDVNQTPLNVPSLHSEAFRAFVESSGIGSPSVKANPYLLESPMYQNFVEERLECSDAAGEYDVLIVFHGTHLDNVDSILRNGLDPTLRRGQSLGQGEYFASCPALPLRYCCGGNTMLVFAVIATKTDVRGQDIIVVKNGKRQLPIATLSFESFDPAAKLKADAFQSQVTNLWKEVVEKEKLVEEIKTKEKIVRLLLAREYDAASEAYNKACGASGAPPQSWAEEVATYVRDHIRDDETVDIYFPGLPARAIKSSALSILNVQQCEKEANEAKRKYESISKGK